MFLLGPGINSLERFFFSNAWSFLYRVMKTQLFHCSKWKCKKHYPYEETVAANIFITKSISRLWAWSTPYSRAILCVSQEHNFFFFPQQGHYKWYSYSHSTLCLFLIMHAESKEFRACAPSPWIFCSYSLLCLLPLTEGNNLISLSSNSSPCIL